MTLLTRKQVAALTNRSTQAIGISVKRGHLIETNKKIDTNLTKNKEHLAKFITKSITTDKTSPPSGSVHHIDLELKEHELLLKKIKIKKEKLDLSKKEAKLIEVLEAKEIFNRSIIILSNQYRNTSKLYIMELAAKYRIPDKDLAGIHKVFDNTINQSVAQSKNLIAKECKIVSDEYSQKIEPGENVN